MSEDASKPAGAAEKKSPDETSEGIGCGVFLLLAGLLLLGKELGWIPFQTEWLFPAILIAWGSGIIYKVIKKK
jgi:hypothetical protein